MRLDREIVGDDQGVSWDDKGLVVDVQGSRLRTSAFGDRDRRIQSKRFELSEQ